MDTGAHAQPSNRDEREPVRVHGAMAIPPVVFCLGTFELDGNLFELRSAGRRVAVQPKVLRLLFYLVAHRDRVVTSDELRRALWPGETVCAASLKRAVNAARQALGDTGRWQRSIRTVRGYGYRFVVTLSD
ncbi:MAG TPA: winged helix-turn-helix domain-containing protein [Polyangiaceae bacterium]